MSALAAQQLADLVAGSAGAIQLLGSRVDGTATIYSISLDTSGIPTTGDGITVRGRERFELFVQAAYPHTHPSVTVPHSRWAGTPHVQWASQLCLYAAPSVEWNPADGMRGLLSRLILWLQRAAAGQLDPAGQPLHPPVAYGSYDHGWVVVRPDVGALAPWHDPASERVAVVFAWCAQQGARVDVLEWLTVADVWERVLADDVPKHDAQGRALFVAPMMIISDTLDMEYPADAAALMGALEGYGVSRDTLLSRLVHANLINTLLLGHSVVGEAAVPVMMLLATPARRLDPGQPLAHVSAWHLDALGSKITNLMRSVGPEHEELTADVRQLAEEWLGFAKVRWMIVHEARPEVTRRRDTGSAATWLAGKRVLLLGAGALGAPIAEHCVRAGVAALHIIDKGAVGPGILVRQPYNDADIGYSKAVILATRLSHIGDLTPTASHKHIVTGLLSDPSAVLDYDLVIDATADVGVRTALEHARAPLRAHWPATIGAVFGHTAERGLATIALPAATGATHDILRRTGIDISRNPPPGWEDIADDLFPATPRTELFFPEPGCSAPTFTGSATQTVALASSLFWAALRVLADPDAAPMTAVAATITPPRSGLVPRPLSWPGDLTPTDDSGDYEVRLSSRAFAEIRAEARRGARLRGQHVETGGMVLGAIDDATGIVHVDRATGPSPDSHLSEVYFDHGVHGTQQIVDASLRNTADRVGFVGMWHTHPHGIARPSPTDERGMSQIVNPSGAGKRALMLILGGPQSRWTAFLADGTPPHMYARVVVRDDTPEDSPTGQPFYLSVAAERWFPGGYAYPDPTTQGER